MSNADIPMYVIGFDVETKSTCAKSVLLSASAAVIRVADMQLVSIFDYIFDPNDDTQNGRQINPGTMRWWEDLGSERHKPSVKAKEITWSGTHKLGDCIKNILTELNAYRKSPHVITSCGPDFDMVILKDVADFYQVRYPLSFSRYDSVRTAKRGLDALGEPYLTEELLEEYEILKDEDLRHTSKFDAVEEAVITARFYNVLASLNPKSEIKE